MKNRTVGTGFDALSTSDAGRTVRMVEYIYIQFTHPLADFAAGALFFVDTETVEGDGIEVTVKRPQRTDVSAEGPVHDD
jgi:hypothetical protein